MRERERRKSPPRSGKKKKKKKKERKKSLTRDDQDVGLDLPLPLQHDPFLGEPGDLFGRHAHQPGLLEGEPAVTALPSEDLGAGAAGRRREPLDAGGPVEAAGEEAREAVGPDAREQNGDEEYEEELAGKGDDPTIVFFFYCFFGP